MTLRKIVRWPDPRLQTVSAPIAQITEDIRELAADMLQTMYDAPGRGLAAPQVGVQSRIFVMDTDWRSGEPAPLVFINPEVLSVNAETSRQDEGCLSIPGVTACVERPSVVELRWRDLDDQEQQRAFSGFSAACVQHEMDHLDGIVTLDRLSEQDRTDALADYAQGAA